MKHKKTNVYLVIYIIYINNCKMKGRRVNIGGDHSTTIATGAYTLNYYKNPKFLWFDAHGDINDYKNSLKNVVKLWENIIM